MLNEAFLLQFFNIYFLHLCKMNSKIINWLIFVVLCLIWGSSFELMKLALFEDHDVNKPILSPFHLAALRMLSAGVVMLPFAIKALKLIPKPVLKFAVLSGLLGSFFPAFLFALAETKIGGGIAGGLNSLTPLFVIIVGSLFYNLQTSERKIMGVLVGLVGSFLFVYAQVKGQAVTNSLYIFYAILATIFYGFNVNTVMKKLTGVSSTHIAAIAFSSLIIPSFLILFSTNFFSLPLGNEKYLLATISSCVLGIVGTAIASILFYILMKRAGGIFASTVTYGIPFVALGWGVLHHEGITLLHIIGLIVILAGVFIANKS
jgi:drug/metabolite transporter (DMT)-like permease